MSSLRVHRKYFRNSKLTSQRNKFQMMKKILLVVSKPKLKRLKCLSIKWTLTYKQSKWKRRITGLQIEALCLREVFAAQNSVNHLIDNMQPRQDLTKMKIVKSVLTRNRQSLPSLQLMLELWIQTHFIHKIYLWGQNTSKRRRKYQYRQRKKLVRYHRTNLLLKTSHMSGWMEHISRKSQRFKQAKALEKSLSWKMVFAQLQ